MRALTLVAIAFLSIIFLANSVYADTRENMRKKARAQMRAKAKRFRALKRKNYAQLNEWVHTSTKMWKRVYKKLRRKAVMGFATRAFIKGCVQAYNGSPKSGYAGLYHFWKSCLRRSVTALQEKHDYGSGSNILYRYLLPRLKRLASNPWRVWQLYCKARGGLVAEISKQGKLAKSLVTSITSELPIIKGRIPSWKRRFFSQLSRYENCYRYRPKESRVNRCLASRSSFMSVYVVRDTNKPRKIRQFYEAEYLLYRLIERQRKLVNPAQFRSIRRMVAYLLRDLRSRLGGAKISRDPCGTNHKKK